MGNGGTRGGEGAWRREHAGNSCGFLGECFLTVTRNPQWCRWAAWEKKVPPPSTPGERGLLCPQPLPDPIWRLSADIVFCSDFGLFQSFGIKFLKQLHFSSKYITSDKLYISENSTGGRSSGSHRFLLGSVLEDDFVTNAGHWGFSRGFPGGSDGKESACNAGDQGSISGLGRSPGEENGNPLQYSCLENSTDRGFSLDKTAFGEKIKRLGGEIKYIYIYICLHNFTTVLFSVYHLPPIFHLPQAPPSNTGSAAGGSESSVSTPSIAPGDNPSGVRWQQEARGHFLSCCDVTLA